MIQVLPVHLVGVVEGQGGCWVPPCAPWLKGYL